MRRCEVRRTNLTSLDDNSVDATSRDMRVSLAVGYATLVSTCSIGCSGSSTGTFGPTSDASTDASSDGAADGSSLPQSKSCLDYLECLAVVSPASVGAGLESYGPRSACWTDDRSADLCNRACQAALDQCTTARADGGAPSDAGRRDSGDGGPRICTSGCTSNVQCQSTCPAPPANSVNCCDRPSGICFAMNGNVCP